MSTTVNGISIDSLNRFKEIVAQFPEKALVKFSVTSSWRGKSTTRVDASSYTLGEVEIQKSFSFESDELDGFYDYGDGPNPQELLIAAVNACMMVAYVVHSASRGIQLERLEVQTSGVLDLRGFLGVDSNVQPGFEDLNYVVVVQGNANASEWDALHKAVKQTAPNYSSLIQKVRMNGELIVDDS